MTNETQTQTKPHENKKEEMKNVVATEHEHEHEHAEHSHEHEGHNQEHAEHSHEHEGHNHEHAHEHEHEHTASKDKSAPQSDLVDNDKVKVDNKKSEKVKQEITKKDEASANGLSLPLSKKHCMYLGTFIKGKPIDLVISQLEEVIKMKRAIAYKGEIPHRHQEGMMSGRYPVKASKAFIPLLKGLKGNAIANGMDIDKVRITACVPNWASRPSRSGGRRGKRVHVLLKAREVVPSEKPSRPSKSNKQEKKTENKTENKSGEKK